MHCADRIECGAVFATSTGRHLTASGLRFIFKQHLTDAGLPPFRFHDLRHTALTRLAERGATPAIIMAIAGHTSATMALEVYTHASLDAIKSVLLSESMSLDPSTGNADAI